MLRLHRIPLAAAVIALALILALYAGAGTSKDSWTWIDVISEGGTALMAGVWMVIVLASRPSGLVTRLLALGLAGIMLGAWADCLDELFRVPKDHIWDNWLEDVCTLGGMLALTAGLYYWRHEQLALTAHLQKRERLFRDHRAFDRVTQLANAGYLREQLRIERARQPGQPCALVLLDIERFHEVNRQHGYAEGDRVLQAVGHMLLLNMRNGDLLCRYAGDRFAVLMPGTTAADAHGLARHLCFMVRHMHHHAGGDVVRLRLRQAIAPADTGAAPEDLLAALNRSIDTPAAVAA